MAWTRMSGVNPSFPISKLPNTEKILCSLCLLFQCKMVFLRNCSSVLTVTLYGTGLCTWLSLTPLHLLVVSCTFYLPRGIVSWLSTVRPTLSDGCQEVPRGRGCLSALPCGSCRSWVLLAHPWQAYKEHSINISCHFIYNETLKGL